MSLGGGKKLLERLGHIAKSVSEKEVHTGFLSDARYEDGTPAAQVAFWNEYGTLDDIDVEGGGFFKHTPPRPFMRNAIASHSKEWGTEAGQLLKANDYDLDMTLNQVGQKMRDDIGNEMIAFADPSNKPSTVKKKGFDKPLIDTGLLHREFLDFEVVKNESS